MSVQKVDFKKVTKEKTPYTIFHSEVVQKITDAVAGFVWIYLLSLPPDWAINKQHLRKHFGFGRHKLDQALTFLHKSCLIEYIQNRDENGFFVSNSINVLCGDKFVQIHEDNSGPQETGCLDNQQHTKENNNYINKNNINYMEPKKPKRLKINRSQKPKKRIDIPPDFTPSDNHILLAQNLGLDAYDQSKRFIDYYLSTGKQMKNYNAAFNNWLRKAADFAKQANVRQTDKTQDAFGRYQEKRRKQQGRIIDANSNRVEDDFRF